MKKLKVYSVNTGETEWVAAISEQAALDFLKSETGEDYAEAEIYELPESQWAILMVQYDEIDTDGKPVIKSFDTIMNEVDDEDTEPFFIACTTW